MNPAMSTVSSREKCMAEQTSDAPGVASLHGRGGDDDRRARG
jgi:hypothetical protein